MTRCASLRAHAKINWGLELLGKRPDGFHEVRTVTHTISLCDTVRVQAAGEGISVAVEGEWPAPADGTNLCWRAARAYMDAFGAPPGVRISLQKRVPAGSGLGGGSSDCVATLAGLSHLTGLGDTGALHSLAARLGSDTALFLYGGAALCCGRGEVVKPIPCGQTYHLALARPAEGVPTAGAYSGLRPGDFSDGRGMDALCEALSGGAGPGELAPLLRNAFLETVGRRLPKVGRAIELLLESGAPGAQMTGSGSAVFGLAYDAPHAVQLARRLAAAGFWTAAAHTTDSGYTLVREPCDD